MTNVPVGRRHDRVTQAAGRLIRRGNSDRRWALASLRAGIAIVVGVLLACLLQPVLGLPPPNQQNFNAVLVGPSPGHWFGTDSLGRDVLSRTLAGGRLDLRVAVTLTAISAGIGVSLGAVSGFFTGTVDSVIMRLADVALAFPIMVLVIALVAIGGPGLYGVYIGVPLVSWALYARLTRAEMLVVREKDFIFAARTLGFSRRRVLIRHALPNVWRAALVYIAADMVLNIAFLASLSFLGLGVQPPTPEWGAIIADGEGYLLSAWWITTLPGLVLVLAGIGLSLISDSSAELLG